MGRFGAGGRLHADDDVGNGFAPFFVIAERRVKFDRHCPVDVDFFRRRVAVAPIPSLVIEGRDVGPERLLFPFAGGRINLCPAVRIVVLGKSTVVQRVYVAASVGHGDVGRRFGAANDIQIKTKVLILIRFRFRSPPGPSDLIRVFCCVIKGPVDHTGFEVKGPGHLGDRAVGRVCVFEDLDLGDPFDARRLARRGRGTGTARQRL